MGNGWGWGGGVCSGDNDMGRVLEVGGDCEDCYSNRKDYIIYGIFCFFGYDLWYF